MTKSQEDFMNMVFTTLGVLNASQETWQNNVPFTATIALVTEKSDAVTDEQSKQDKTHTGVTTDKKNKRNALESNMIMAGHILAYLGAATGNTILQEQMDFGPADLAHKEETKLLGLAKIVVDDAKQYSDAALPFGLTTDLQTALSKSYDDFSAVLSAPRIAIINVSDATDTISALIGDLRTLIKTQLDKGMMLYRDTPLYGLYQKARIIVNSPTHHLALTGVFTDGSGKPVADAKVTITGSKEGGEKVLRKTSPLGNIRVQNLVAGDYVLIVEKPGFTAQEINFTIAPPQTTKLDVVMK